MIRVLVQRHKSGQLPKFLSYQLQIFNFTQRTVRGMDKHPPHEGGIAPKAFEERSGSMDLCALIDTIDLLESGFSNLQSDLYTTYTAFDKITGDII